MLAEKYAYLEEMVPELEPQRREPTRNKKQNRQEQPKTASARKHQTLNKTVTIGLVLVCFMAACFIVYRYDLIANNHRSILELEKQLEQEITQRENLEVELSCRKNLDSIEFMAAEMGMKYPDEDQIRYVDLPEKQTVAEQADASNQLTDQSLLNRILGLIY